MRIDVTGLAKRYGRTRALNGVSLAIRSGAIVAVLGANGSGKTTLLRCLAGLAAPDQGEILYDGRVFARDEIELRRRLMFLPDFPFALWEMTPLQHMGMCLNVYGRHRPGVEELAVELLRELDMLPLADAPLANLSRGQFYKAALTGLMVVDPELWLLDEPFASGMDPQGISMFRKRAREATARGATILYTTQIVEVVERFSDLVCVLHEGELRGMGTLAELREQSARDEALAKIFLALKDDQ